MTTSTPPQSPPPPLPPSPEPPAGGPPPPWQPTRPPLRRSRTDKVIGGVGGGLAEYTGIDALLWRVGFIALVFAGGTGFLVYLLLWLLMPARPVDPHAPQPEPRAVEPRSPVPGVTVAALLITLGVTALVAWATPWSPGPVVFLSIALLVVGLGLGVGAFVGGRSARGPLVALGVLLTFAVVVASAGHGWQDRTRGGVGDRSYAPATADAVRADYRSGVGDTELDLTGIDLADLTAPITTTVDAGIGDVEVVVPRSADVQVDVQNGVGETDVFGDGSQGGFFPGTGSRPWTGDSTPEVVLTIQSGIGDVTVSRG
ncbi:PspC domain-containing protein [Klenkia brasiliensis]|uniref:Phage shock protein C (PspC) family protein n=1 Tax=Klenkia brasiliensis TaxID=333142 RepID=A0A1G7R9R6_9ACTN|nr:PspC domain-containing protein [Klenkia brasiliensis]SDG06889.1 phage shock protein C (PspC) family protein [Klenkia brasiliensis]